MLRWPLLGLSTPKVWLVGFVSGLPKSGVLKTLKASARNWKRMLSVKRNDLLSDMSNCHAEGWRRFPKRNGMVRSVLAARILQAGLAQVSRALREPFEAVTNRTEVPAGTVTADESCVPLKKLPAGSVVALICWTQLLK